LGPWQKRETGEIRSRLWRRVEEDWEVKNEGKFGHVFLSKKKLVANSDVPVREKEKMPPAKGRRGASPYNKEKKWSMKKSALVPRGRKFFQKERARGITKGGATDGEGGGTGRLLSIFPKEIKVRLSRAFRSVGPILNAKAVKKNAAALRTEVNGSAWKRRPSEAIANPGAY